MGDIFQNYTREIREYIDAVHERIITIPSLSGTQKRNEIRAAENQLEEADEVMQTMSLGLRSVPDPARKAALRQQVDELEAELSSVRRALKEAEVKLNDDRASLFGDVTREIDDSSSLGQREKMAAATSQMEADNELLKDAIVTTHRIKETSIHIMTDLEDQRNTMLGIRGRFANINDSLSEAGRTMSAMGRKLMTNKLIIGGVILMLMLAIALILWLKLK